MIFRLGAAISILALSAAGFACFHPLLGIGLLIQSLFVCRYPKAGLAVLFVTLPLDWARPLPGGVVVSFSELHLAVCCAALVLRAGGLPVRDWRPLIWWWPLLASVAISGFVNIEWFKIVPHTLRNAELAVVACLTLYAYRESDAGPWLDWALAATTALQFCLVFQHLLFQESLPRMSGSLSNPNQFGGLMGLVAVLSSTRLLACRCKETGANPGRWALLRGATALGALLAILLSGSRLALGSCSLGILAGSGLARRGNKRVVLSRIGGTALLLLVLLSLGGLLLTQASSLQAAAENWIDRMGAGMWRSMEARIQIFGVAAELWMESPIVGIGPGRWDDELGWWLASAREGEALVDSRAMSESHAFLAHAHSLPLQLAALYGLLGLAAFGYAGIRWWKAFARGDGTMSAAGLALLLTFGANNLLDSLFPSLAMETGWILGILLAGAASGQRDGKPLSSIVER
ncbi:MAG TPA: O-antigen ligase family protein [Acidobacteriota bacterium]|nr:O-antigen ligase family protein [Acidobacteriota bacterium]